MSTLRSGQWTAHEAIYWPDSDKLRHRYRYEGLKSLLSGLEFSPHDTYRKMKLGRRPRHTSNLPVCSGRRKLTTGSRANRLRPQKSSDFERPSRLPPNLLSTCRPNREKLVITVCPDGLWTSSRDVNAPPTRYDL